MENSFMLHFSVGNVTILSSVKILICANSFSVKPLKTSSCFN